MRTCGNSERGYMNNTKWSKLLNSISGSDLQFFPNQARLKIVGDDYPTHEDLDYAIQIVLRERTGEEDAFYIAE